MNRTTLNGILTALSTAFESRNIDALLAMFDTSPTVTYAGSEAGETATGPDALRRLFTELFSRDETYSFHFPHPVHSQSAGALWVFSDGEGVETHPHRPPRPSPTGSPASWSPPRPNGDGRC